MDASPPRARRASLAIMLGLLCNGLGHVYAGRLGAGVAVFAAWYGVFLAACFGIRLGPGPAIACLALTLAYWLAQAIHAGFAARRERETPRPWFSSPAALILFFLAATAVGWAAKPFVNAFLVRTYYMPTGSMLPALEPGDVFVVAPGAPIERGAIVVHEAPPSGRTRDPLLKRVVALAGDTVELRDGRLVVDGIRAPGEELPGPCTYWTRDERDDWVERPCRARTETLGGITYRVYCTPDAPCGDMPRVQVPEGRVFVVGDHRDHSADSRAYGPVRLDAILGRARWIYFSMGPGGVRGDRIGREIR